MITFGFAACLIAVFIGGTEGELLRKLSYQSYAGYEAASDVVSHSRIDLDQKEMEAHLQNSDFVAAKAIYTFGGNSGATAHIDVNALPVGASQGARVTQGDVAFGTVKSTAAAGDTTIKVTYVSHCKDGGSATKDLSGCFTVGGGFISIADVGHVGAPKAVTNVYRSLAGFSTAAQAKMQGQEFYAVYRAYFNQGDYAHQKVMAALEKNGILSKSDDITRTEIAKKTSAYMSVWMYVIREMEDAIIDCQSGCLKCNDDPVHAWDEAVAFYAGSLEGASHDTSGNNPGKLLHELADKRCKNFGTCSAGDGRSAVNAAIMDQFKIGQYKLLSGKCVDAIPIKRRIVELMTVPLVQGSLRYAYKVDKSIFKQSGSKEKAEGAAFSAAVLPRIAVCDPRAAKTIEDNMNLDSSSPMSAGYTTVKQAFESTYKCLGITCEDVGGILTSTGDAYFESAEPCVTVTTEYVQPASQAETGVSLLVLICALAASLVICAVFAVAAWRYGFKSGTDYAKFTGNSCGPGVDAEVVGKSDGDIETVSTQVSDTSARM